MEFVMPSLEFCRTVARHILMEFFFTIKVVSGLAANCELVLSCVLFPTVSSLWHLDHHWESYEILKSWWWNWDLHGEFPVMANNLGTTASRSFFMFRKLFREIFQHECCFGKFTLQLLCWDFILKNAISRVIESWKGGWSIDGKLSVMTELPVFISVTVS